LRAKIALNSIQLISILETEAHRAEFEIRQPVWKAMKDVSFKMISFDVNRKFKEIGGNRGRFGNSAGRLRAK
jgi:hypothetical protein